MIEKINPAIPIPIESSSIPDEQRVIMIAKSNIAIPNPIFFIVNSPLQIPFVSVIITYFLWVHNSENPANKNSS